MAARDQVGCFGSPALYVGDEDDTTQMAELVTTTASVGAQGHLRSNGFQSNVGQRWVQQTNKTHHNVTHVSLMSSFTNTGQSTSCFVRTTCRKNQIKIKPTTMLEMYCLFLFHAHGHHPRSSSTRLLVASFYNCMLFFLFLFDDGNPLSRTTLDRLVLFLVIFLSKD